METPGKAGVFKPTAGTINIFEPPSGPGIRVDTFGYAGYKTSTRYDSLLAKLPACSDSSVEDARREAADAREQEDHWRARCAAQIIVIRLLQETLDEAKHELEVVQTSFVTASLRATAPQGEYQRAVCRRTCVRQHMT